MAFAPQRTKNAELLNNTETLFTVGKQEAK